MTACAGKGLKNNGNAVSIVGYIAPHPGCIRNGIHSQISIFGKQKFHDRLKAGHGRAHTSHGKGALTNRCADNPFGSKIFIKPTGGAPDAGFDIQSHDHHVFIAQHFLSQGLCDGLRVVFLSHIYILLRGSSNNPLPYRQTANCSFAMPSRPLPGCGWNQM